MSSLSPHQIGTSKNILQIQNADRTKNTYDSIKDILLETNISFTPTEQDY